MADPPDRQPGQRSLFELELEVIEPSEEGVKDGGACMAGLGRVGDGPAPQ
jgi:hypothetical protein